MIFTTIKLAINVDQLPKFCVHALVKVSGCIPNTICIACRITFKIINKCSPIQIFLKLATQKGNDIIFAKYPNRPKKWGHSALFRDIRYRADAIALLGFNDLG